MRTAKRARAHDASSDDDDAPSPRKRTRPARAPPPIEVRAAPADDVAGPNDYWRAEDAVAEGYRISSLDATQVQELNSELDRLAARIGQRTNAQAAHVAAADDPSSYTPLAPTRGDPLALLGDGLRASALLCSELATLQLRLDRHIGRTWSERVQSMLTDSGWVFRNVVHLADGRRSARLYTPLTESGWGVYAVVDGDVFTEYIVVHVVERA
jgi:hypothetical protein